MRLSSSQLIARAVRTLFAAAAALTMFGAHAGQIDSISGTVANGQTIVINGSGFGSKANAKPLYYWDFENGTATSPLSRNSFDGGVRGALSTATSLKPLNSRGILTIDVAGQSDAMGPDGVPFSSNSLYVWAKKYYEFNIVTDAASNGLNLKFFRLWYPYTHNVYSSYAGGSGGANSGRVVAEMTGTATTWFQLPHQSDKWIIDEWEYRAGSIGAVDGILNYTRGGISAFPRANRIQMRTSSYPNSYSVLYFDQISNNQLSAGKYLHFDAIYVDDTWHRVVISDEATWQNIVYGSGGTERSREVQIPITWSDSRIEISVRQGGYSSLTGKYLYVIGADGNPVNSSGFRIGDASTNPRPPSSVSVQ
ncbi:hypothetical protein [Povalibacter sp.]|uniref:hypothetical protein n=1 Tax=Povalibacter sp. TaxID=1962978 RepID=UPI002D1FA95D|nr:hypothetical protein [Povalibacter sp.]